MTRHAALLNPERALIFRITHRDNLPWILDHGLHCAASAVKDPGYVQIGKPDLIAERGQHPVRLPSAGTLADYVPFYFTPFSPMLMNIVTGRGVPRRGRDEICILVSSLHRLAELGLPFVFTDRHAYLQKARFFTELSSLTELDWPRWQAQDFRRNPDDPEPFERYQAEALIRDALPLVGLLGLVCHEARVAATMDTEIARRGLQLKTAVRPTWFF